MLVGCVWGAQRQSLSQKVGSVVGPNQRLAYCSRSFFLKICCSFFFPPHLCVGFLFLILYPGSSPPPRLLPPPPLHKHLSHTILVNHHLSHTIFHTPSLTHHLSHTSLSTTIFHTPSLTHIFFNHHLSHTIFYTPSFVFHLVWHLATYTFVLRGRRGTCGIGLALVARLGRFWSPVTPRHFAWQAWPLVTSTFVSRGRRGTWSHPPSFCVAGVALMALSWLWWRAWAGFGRR